MRFVLWDWPRPPRAHTNLWPSTLETLTSPLCRRPSTTTCSLYLGYVWVLALSSPVAASLSNFRWLWRGSSLSAATTRRHLTCCAVCVGPGARICRNLAVPTASLAGTTTFIFILFTNWIFASPLLTNSKTERSLIALEEWNHQHQEPVNMFII